MKLDLYNGIIKYDAPPLIGAKITKNDGWPYDLDAHAMVISGARFDKEYFRIADPYYQRKFPNGSPFYSMSADKIYKSLSGNGASYIF